MWFLAALLILSVFLTPASMLIRPDYFLGVLLCLLGMSKRSSTMFRLAARETWLLILLAIFSVFSIAVQLTGKGFALRDLMILVRYVVYIATLFAGIAVGLSSTRINILWYVALGLIILIIAISFAQYFNIGRINTIMIPIYTVADRYSVLEEGLSWRRIIGTMGNPNYWGFFIGSGLILSAYMCLQKRLLFAAPTLLLFVCIIMTGSRTSLLAALLAIITSALVIASTGKRLNLKTFTPVLLTAAILGGMYIAYSYFTADYYESHDRFSTNNLGTLELRMKWWGQVLSTMLAEPYTFVLGRGPNKLENVRYGDNIYILYLRDFGLIGLGLYLMFLRLVTRTLLQLTRQLARNNPALSQLAAVTLLLFVQLATFDMAADGWFNVRIAELLLFCYGFTLGLAHKHRQRRKLHESIHRNS